MLYYSEDSLVHHGVQGMKWGIRNGPPYPLTASSHGATQTRNSGEKAAHRVLDKTEHDGLLAATAIYLAPYVAMGAVVAAAVVADAAHEAKRKKSISKSQGQELKRQEEQEPLEKSLLLANPTAETRNCTNCSIAGVLRMQGYDVSARTRSAKVAGGFEEFLNSAFHDANVKRLSSTDRASFASSADVAARYLKKEYGNNAAGVIAVGWKNSSSGHAFSWRIQNGKVEFLDFQSGRGDNDTRRYWPRISTDKSIFFARLDDKSPNLDTIYEVIQNGIKV